MSKLWNKFYECSCGGEGLVLSNEAETEDLMDIAFFKYGYDGKQLTFKNRLRWCWCILKNGYPFNDQVLLDKEVALDLGRDLVRWGKKKIKKGESM